MPYPIYPQGMLTAIAGVNVEGLAPSACLSACITLVRYPPCFMPWPFFSCNYWQRSALACAHGNSCSEVQHSCNITHHDPDNASLQVSCLGIPIYITETGIADAQDERRPALIQSYFEQVGNALWCRTREDS
jgi:hypothetical protein